MLCSVSSQFSFLSLSNQHGIVVCPVWVFLQSVTAVVTYAYVLVWFCISVPNGINHSPPTLNGAPSPPQRFSNGPASSSSSSLTNQQLPATCGARQLSKLKRFLTTLQQFGNDISPEIGEKVRTLVLALVVSTNKWSPGSHSRLKPLKWPLGLFWWARALLMMGTWQPTCVYIAQYYAFVAYGKAIYQASLNFV